MRWRLEAPEKPWSDRRSWRALVISKMLDWERFEAAAKEAEDLAMASRYLVPTRVRVSRAEN